MTRAGARRFALSGGLATAIAGIFGAAVLAFPNTGVAQELNFNFGEGGSMTGQLLRMIALLTILSLAPGILVVVTSFTRIVVVFSLLRSAIGLQQTPPNTVIISLALFLTAFIMMPTLQQSYREGIAPLIAEEITEEEAFDRTVGPLRMFMLRQVREEDLAMFLDLSNEGAIASPEDTPLRALVPAFMISGLRDWLSHLHTVSRHRHGGGRHSALNGHDDAAAGDDLTAVQVDILRLGGWLDAALEQPGRKLHTIITAGQLTALASFLSSTGDESR